MKNPASGKKLEKALNTAGVFIDKDAIFKRSRHKAR